MPDGVFWQLRHRPLCSKHLQHHDGGLKGMNLQVERLVATADIAIALLVATSLPMPDQTSD